MNRIHRSLACSLLCMSIGASKQSHAAFEFGMFNPEEEDHFEEIVQHQKATRANSCITAEAILEIIAPPTGVINAPLLLQENIYNYTNPPHTRPLLSLPTLITYPIVSSSDECFSCMVRINGFFNQTHKMYFTKKSPYLCSYINFQNATILQQLEDLKAFNLDIGSVLPLFYPIKLQERRFGAALGATGSRKRWSVTADVPLYYLEHNFYLTQKEQNAIESAPFFNNFDENFLESSTQISPEVSPVKSSAVSKDGQKAIMEEYGKEHLVNDKFGLGDAFVRVFYDVTYSERYKTLVGLHMDFPTAYTAKQKFFIGGTFEKDLPQPPFSFENFFNLIVPDDCRDIQKAKEIALGLLEGALDRLSANEVDLSLGNNGHFGFGPVIKCNALIDSHWSMQFDGYIEYQIPSTETRFFLGSKNAAEFDRDYQDAARAQTNLQFLSDQLVNTIYPFAVQTKVSPGVQAVGTLQAMSDFKHSNLRFGTDFWFQGREHVSFPEQSQYNCTNLQVSKGRMSDAYQFKIFGEVGYKKESKNLDWTAHLAGDYTLAHSGIGRDFTVVIGTRIFF